MSSKKPGDRAAESMPSYDAAPAVISRQSSIYGDGSVKEDEDVEDLAIANARIRALQKGQSRLITGPELKKRLDAIRSS